MKKAIFTVNLNNYDPEPLPDLNNPDWDTILITDESPENPEAWTVVHLVDTTDRPSLEAKKYKWLSHKFLPEYDLVCYHDANLQVVGRLPEMPFRIRHPKRKTVFEEAVACIQLSHRAATKSVTDQMNFFNQQGFPDDRGLFLNGFFARVHEPEENALCEAVYNTMRFFTSRDQLALPYAMWKRNYQQDYSQVLPSSFFNSNLEIRGHNRQSPRVYSKSNVHHITPARSDKNFGRAINDLIRPLPESDWVVLRDIDTLPLLHAEFIKQCEDIANKGEYGLVGAITNRSGHPWQVHKEMSDNPDFSYHMQIAIDRYKDWGTTVLETDQPIAGFMQMFPKSVWTEVGGFREGSIMFSDGLLDHIFWKSIQESRYKIGIAQGIYLWHTYRWDKDRRDKEHLI